MQCVRRTLRFAGFALVLTTLCGPVRAADPQPYTVDLPKTGDATLDGVLKDSSDLEALREKAPVSPFALIMRAQNDKARLATALQSFGYYKGSATIQIAGHALDDPTLPNLLQALPADKKADVTIKIDRGTLFHIRKISIKGAVPDDARAKLGIAPGDPALAAKVLAGTANMLLALRETGHALAKVSDPVAFEIPADNALDVTYTVDIGPRVDIGPIAFAGLQDVNESYVQRRVLLHQGQLYQPSTIEAARQDLSATGVFSSVQAHAADAVDANGQIPVTFDVKERPKHVVGVTGAYSTDLGASAAVTWSDRNLFGNAEQLNLKAAAIDLGGSSTNGIGYDVSAQLVQPDFLRRDQTMTYTLEAVKQSFDAYDQRAYIASAVLGRTFSPHWSGSVGLQGEEETIDQEGVSRDYTLAEVPVSAKYDSTNSLFAPTQGVRINLSGTPTASFGGNGGSSGGGGGANNGGNGYFAVLQAVASTYLDFGTAGNSVLALRVTGATVQGASTFEIPPDQRLYAGGSATVRGYKYQSVGPQFADHNPVGGTEMAAATVELRQHVWGSFGMAAFADAGEVIGARGNSYGMQGPDTGGRLAVGAGIGARYATPIGPVRLDIAVPLVRFPGGDSFELYIGIGEAF